MKEFLQVEHNEDDSEKQVLTLSLKTLPREIWTMNISEISDLFSIEPTRKQLDHSSCCASFHHSFEVLQYDGHTDNVGH